jgi:hypothetical protein
LASFAAAVLAMGCDGDGTGDNSNGGAAGAGATHAGGGGAGGSGAQGGSGGSTGASEACQTCVAELYTNDAACAAAIQACDGDPACDTWKNCSEDCFNFDDTVACYDACDASYPHDAALSDPLIDCTCTACGNLCVASC